MRCPDMPSLKTKVWRETSCHRKRTLHSCHFCRLCTFQFSIAGHGSGEQATDLVGRRSRRKDGKESSRSRACPTRQASLFQVPESPQLADPRSNFLIALVPRLLVAIASLMKNSISDATGCNAKSTSLNRFIHCNGCCRAKHKVFCQFMLV